MIKRIIIINIFGFLLTGLFNSLLATEYVRRLEVEQNENEPTMAITNLLENLTLPTCFLENTSEFQSGTLFRSFESNRCVDKTPLCYPVYNLSSVEKIKKYAAESRKQVQKAIVEMGGVLIDDSKLVNYSHTAQGFALYLKDSNVPESFINNKMVSMISANHDDIALNFGYKKVTFLDQTFVMFLPPKTDWVQGVLLAIVMSEIQKITDIDVLRNWWRPAGYNEAVDGVKYSAHVTAHAVDMDFSSVHAREKAQRYLCDHFFKTGRYFIGVGVGRQSIHIDFYSMEAFVKKSEGKDPKRQWSYAGYEWSESAGSCFKF